jgi:hypothetical protein
MKRNRFTVEQIIRILERSASAGKIAEHPATFRCAWFRSREPD